MMNLVYYSEQKYNAHCKPHGMYTCTLIIIYKLDHCIMLVHKLVILHVDTCGSTQASPSVPVLRRTTNKRKPEGNTEIEAGGEESGNTTSGNGK